MGFKKKILLGMLKQGFKEVLAKRSIKKTLIIVGTIVFLFFMGSVALLGYGIHVISKMI
ncbi:MAG: hypothetical protein ACYDG6_04395 [Thermincolia bacterium]